MEVKPNIIQKPWGYEEIWSHTSKYVGKILYINKGHQLSLQHHRKKEETIRVLSGLMHLRVGKTLEEALKNELILMEPGSIYHIPPGLIHRMIALEDVQVLEVSTPELDDVVRHDDSYGRIF